MTELPTTELPTGKLHQKQVMKSNILFDILNKGGLPEHSWQREAACSQADPDVFFPERGISTRDAKLICSACPVRKECLEYALMNGERFGVWGGLSGSERRLLRRSR